MEHHSAWVGFIAEALDSVLDTWGPEALRRTILWFGEDSGCGMFFDVDPGFEVSSESHAAVQCHVAECPESADLISEMIRLGCSSSGQPQTVKLIDLLAHAVALKMRQKMGIDEHEALIWRLYRRRCTADPAMSVIAEMSGTDPMDVATEMLVQGSAEATIVRICEQFFALLDKGHPEGLAVQVLHQAHASALQVAGQNLPPLRPGATLLEYVRQCVAALHGHGAPVSDSYLTYAIQEIKRHYGRLS